MSYETEAGAYAHTVPQTLFRPYVFGLDGRTPTAQMGGEAFSHPSTFPEDDILGTQPIKVTDPAAPSFDRYIGSYPVLDAGLEAELIDARKTDAQQPPEVSLAEPDDPEPALPAQSAEHVIEAETEAQVDDLGRTWSGRVKHVPASPGPFVTRSGRRELLAPTPSEGVLNTNTVFDGTRVLPAVEDDTEILPVVADESAAEPAVPATTESEKPLWRSVRWYNPADVSRYIGVKLRPEAWTNRVRVGVGIGGVAMVGVGAALAWHGAKHGGAQQLWGGQSHDSPPAPHDESVVTTPAPEHIAPSSDLPHANSHQPHPAPEAEYRQALGYDAHTHRASNVDDWSIQALTRAGKKAGLSADQISQLAHNRHNIHSVDSAFYNQNHSVGSDPNHYLNKTAYRVDAQQETADTIVTQYVAKHSLNSAATVPDTLADTTQQSIPPLTDKQMNDIIRESQETLNETAASAPAIQPALPAHEAFAGFTERELQNIGKALGAIAGYAAVHTGVRAWQGARLAKDRAPENYGGITSHRAIPFHTKPTIPAASYPSE